MSQPGVIEPSQRWHGRQRPVVFAAANHDPRHWDDPDTLDLTRDPSGHVGFGMGIDQCVGQHVARLEAGSLIHTLLRRASDLHLTGEPVRHLNTTLRAWDSLPMHLNVG